MIIINIPSGRRFPNFSVLGANGSLPTSIECLAQKPKIKKNSVFQFLSDVTSDFINLQSFPLAVNWYKSRDCLIFEGL